MNDKFTFYIKLVNYSIFIENILLYVYNSSKYYRDDFSDTNFNQVLIIHYHQNSHFKKILY